MTGKEAYIKLKKNIDEQREEGISTLEIHSDDAKDLKKLKTTDLIELGFSIEKAERVSSDLLGGRLEELGKALCHDLIEKV